MTEQRSSLSRAERCRRSGYRFLSAVVCLLALSSTGAAAADFTVTKTADTNDGVCAADCSLREAIIAANLSPGADRIILGSSLTYTLTIGPADPSGVLAAGSGDLDITDALTIDGNGSTINGAALDRVFDIQGSFPVTINNLTITNGLASGFLSLGGGINILGATVVLNNSLVTANSTALESSSRDDGGGIAVFGSFDAATGITIPAALTLNNSTVSGNTGLNGGGIICVLCTLTLSNSTVSGNTATGMDGGGIDVVGNASSLSVISSTIAGNSVTGAGGHGGGLSVPFGTSAAILDRSRIVSNTAATGSAIFENGGTATATNNWWGCNFGPGTTGAGCTGTPNGVAGSVTTTPFLVLKTTASPATIAPSGSSTATADLTINSASADTSAGGTVPNGIVAAFSATLGTFATPTATTTNGKATDVYTNAATLGAASLTAVVDGQSVSTTVTVAVLSPAVVTGAAGGIGPFGATLTGTANPNGLTTTAQFQYGIDLSYGATTPVVSLGSGNVAVAIGNGAITGLACNTLYHFRATATNGAGTTNGSDATFTTSACPPPDVVTGAASAIGSFGATLNGTANPNTTATNAQFEYGTTIGYGSTTPVVALGSGNVPAAIGSGTITGLACNMLYHFRATATSAQGTTNGSDATFTTSACPPPTVVTGAASGIGSFDATLNGTANPNTTATNARFEYGTTLGYGSTTPVVAIGSGITPVAIGSGTITGLACNTLYHFRATATNVGGTTNGLDATFTTSACPPPTVVTGAASAIGSFGATLNGTANPNTTATDAHFEYGTTLGYGSTTAVVALGSGNTPVAIGSGAIAGLACNTLYHFRATATNVGGTTNGSDATFTTSACPPPTVVTGAASSIGAFGATLNGTANPVTTATDAQFQYGTTAGYGSTTPVVALGSGNVPVAIGNGAITGLACNTLYHFRATATNAGGTTNGSDATFTTSACPPPTVVTGAASGIGAFGATLNGTANPVTTATDAQFQYGTTAGYGSTTPVVALGSGNVPVAIGNGAITGLACNTLYHFRATATNVGGTTNGLDATFTTSACPPPTVVTGAASAIGSFGATLNGTANPTTTATNAQFQYGTTIGYGSTTPVVALGSGNVPVAIGSGAITGLACNTLYHFRATATNIGGTTNGLDATFTTSACIPPTVVTGVATGIGATAATLNGTVNPNTTATTAMFDYGLTAGYGSTTTLQIMGSGSAALPIGGGSLTGLACASVYHFRASATNATGTTNGSDATFTTSACTPEIALAGNLAFGDVHVGVTATNTLTITNSGSATLTVSSITYPTGFSGDWAGGAIAPGASQSVMVTFAPMAATSYAGMVVIHADATSGVASMPAYGRTGTLIWRHAITGENIVWILDGPTVANAIFVPLLADLNWTFAGGADLDGDGKIDVLWRNRATGQNLAWLMSGAEVTLTASLPTIADTNWEIQGLGDFNGDGKADVIWRNKATGQNLGWLMNGGTVMLSAFLPTISDTNWEIKGVGDFSGDGKADLMWRNKVTGQNIGWLMNGLSVTNAAFLPSIADTNWEIAGAGDLNGDGTVEVVWRNKATGQNIAWTMNGNTLVSAAFLPTIADTNWQIKALGDVNGDGKSDVAWRNVATGQGIVWMMNGVTVQSAAFLPTIIDLNWQLVGR